MDAHPAAGGLRHVVTRPQARELVAADGESTDQLDGARMPRLGRDLRPQHRDQLGDGGGPLRARPVGLRVQQQRQQIAFAPRALGELAEQGTGERVPRQVGGTSSGAWSRGRLVGVRAAAARLCRCRVSSAEKLRARARASRTCSDGRTSRPCSMRW
jgi:hypothetical protein